MNRNVQAGKAWVPNVLTEKEQGRKVLGMDLVNRLCEALGIENLGVFAVAIEGDVKGRAVLTVKLHMTDTHLQAVADVVKTYRLEKPDAE